MVTVEEKPLCEDCGRYFNRELSWLKFNERILAEARNSRNPLLERVAFLGIVADNLDEYFMVWVPAYQEGATRSRDEYDEVVGSRTQLEMIYDRTIFMMRNIPRVWATELKPELEKSGIIFPKYRGCSESEKRALRKEHVDILAKTPVPVIRGDRFEDIEHDDYLKGMGLLAKSERGFAVITIQEILDKYGRFVRVGKRKAAYIFREEQLRKNSDLFLPDEAVCAVVPVRLTRGSDLNLKGYDADDLISAIRAAPETLAKNVLRVLKRNSGCLRIHQLSGECSCTSAGTGLRCSVSSWPCRSQETPDVASRTEVSLLHSGSSGRTIRREQNL